MFKHSKSIASTKIVLTVGIEQSDNFIYNLLLCNKYMIVWVLLHFDKPAQV